MTRIGRDAFISLGVVAVVVGVGSVLMALLASNVRLSASAGMPTSTERVLVQAPPPTQTPEPVLAEMPISSPTAEAAPPIVALPEVEPQPREPLVSTTPPPSIELPPAGVEPQPAAQPGRSSTGSSAIACGRRVTHVVQPGENLFRIALRYRASILSIARLNGIEDIRLIRVGQRLRVITCR
ncbi:MAG: LysM peptidoglycan-binding domain-containing protein [Thermoflexales bacterium]